MIVEVAWSLRGKTSVEAADEDAGAELVAEGLGNTNLAHMDGVVDTAYEEPEILGAVRVSWAGTR